MLPLRIPTLLPLLLPLQQQAAPEAAEVADPAPRGIVLVLADDLGHGDLGCYREEPSLLATPRLDRMAAEGLRFTRHYAGSTVCAPSRCVLLTGLHTGHARVRGNSGGELAAGDPTLPRLLAARGYRTACIGKYGVGRDMDPGDPARDGFEDFFGYLDMSHAHNFWPDHLWRNAERVPLENRMDPPWPGPRGQGVSTRRVTYAPELFQAEALGFVREHAGRPFFLYLALNVPHANNEAGGGPRPERGMEVPDPGPFAGRDWPEPEKGFAEMMRRLDRDVGELLDLLDELGIADSTLVLFTSDNGPHSEGGHSAETFDSNGPLRGKKRDLYEGGLRVPLLARWPGTIAPGTVSDHVCGFQDLLPTLAELVGAPLPEGLDGTSFVPTLLGRPRDQGPPSTLYWEFTEQGGKRALLDGPRWKLVQRRVSTDAPLPPELYDLLADPGETTDLAAAHPERVERMLRRMDAEHVPDPVAPLFPSERGSGGH